jgi:ubiquinone/menaquinone biosynthesis C-methylase UbiE
VLCSVESVTAVLAELRRVLKPGGELRFFEHVRAESLGLARLQRALDATVWPLATAGCHTSRQTVEAIRANGWEIVEVDRFDFPDTDAPMPTRPHAIGVARPIH